MSAVESGVGVKPYSLSERPCLRASERRATLCSLEPVKYWQGEGELGVGNGAEVALDAGFQADRGLGFAAGDDGGHLRQGGEILADEGGLPGGDEEIQIVHGFLGAAEGAGHGDAADLRVEAQGFEDFGNQRGDVAQQECRRRRSRAGRWLRGFWSGFSRRSRARRRPCARCRRP